jgi:hypothetical protein
MDLTALIRAFVSAGLLPGLFSEAPLLGSTHIELAGTGSAISPAMIKRLRRVQPASTSDASASAAPLTAADMAGPVPRDGALQNLTPAELAGPVAREGGANPGSADGSAAECSMVLHALGLFTPDGKFNTLDVLGAALTGASALRGNGGSAPPRIAPAWSPDGGSGPLGFAAMIPRAQPVQPVPLRAILLKALGYGG